MLVLLLGGGCFQGVSEGGGGTGASASGGSNASAGASGGTGSSGGAAGGSSGGGSAGSGTGSGGGTTGAPQGPAAVMIVQDLSAENCEPLAPTDAAGDTCVGKDGYCSACVPGNGSCPSSTCRSSFQITQAAMQSVLGTAPARSNLQLGLTVEPGPQGTPACQTGVSVVPVGPGNAGLIVRAYSAVQTAGGSPTAATLLGPVAADPVMKGAGGKLRRYVVLIAGGVPNCDASNPCATEAWSDGNVHGCASPAVLAQQGIQASPPAGCSCSFGSCTEASSLTCCPALQAPEGNFCTDETASVAAVAALYQNLGIVTYVVGVGPVAKAYGSVFDAMAAAGHGSPAHLQADDEASLQTALQQLLAQLAG